MINKNLHPCKFHVLQAISYGLYARSRNFSKEIQMNTDGHTQLVRMLNNKCLLSTWSPSSGLRTVQLLLFVAFFSLLGRPKFFVATRFDAFMIVNFYANKACLTIRLVIFKTSVTSSGNPNKMWCRI